MGVSKTIPPQRKDYKGYLSFLFLWGKNRGDRFERFRKIDVIENYCRVDPNYEGKVIWSKEHSIGYLPQEPQLDDSKTVKEVVPGGCSGGDGFVEGVRGGEHEVCRTDE